MSSNERKSLKSQNMKWLISLTAADSLAILVITSYPEMEGISELTKTGMYRLLAVSLAPLFVLLLVNVIPSDTKNMLVYWRTKNTLPSGYAFSKLIFKDHRIDIKSLEKNVGKFPEKTEEQTATWYRLYKKVSAEPEIIESHKAFLMYRDMAALTVGLLIPCFASLAILKVEAFLLMTAILVIQFILCSISARWSGERFVCNVLALHSHKNYRLAGVKKDEEKSN